MPPAKCGRMMPYLVTQLNHLENNWVFSCFKCGEEDPGTNVSWNKWTRFSMTIEMAQGKFRSDLHEQAAMGFPRMFYMLLRCLSFKKQHAQTLALINIYVCTIKHWLFQNITAMMISKNLQAPTLLPNYWSHYVEHKNVIKVPLSNFCLWCLYVEKGVGFSHYSLPLHLLSDTMLNEPYFEWTEIN